MVISSDYILMLAHRSRLRSIIDSHVVAFKRVPCSTYRTQSCKRFVQGTIPKVGLRLLIFHLQEHKGVYPITSSFRQRNRVLTSGQKVPCLSCPACTKQNFPASICISPAHTQSFGPSALSNTATRKWCRFVPIIFKSIFNSLA